MIPKHPAFRLVPHGVEWSGNGETLRIEAWGHDGLRVRSRIKEPLLSPDWALQNVDPIEPVTTFSDSAVSITNGAITAVITANSYFDGAQGYGIDTCEVSFQDSSGKTFLRELDSHGALKRKARDFHPLAGGGFSLTAGFQSSPSEHLVGMGMYQEDLIDLKGATFALTQRNSQATVPFVVSSEGYGFLWNNPALGQAVFGTNRTEWRAQATDQLDYWVTAGKTPRDIAKRYAEVTGHAPVMPEYALGLWQSKLRYKSQDELLQVAREYHKRGIPLEVIVADFFHWPNLGDFRFEDEFWPDPAAMCQELESMGTKLMVSVWPQVSVHSENYAEMRQKGYLVHTDLGLDVQMAFGAPSMLLDATNPDARKYVWDLCNRNYRQKGVTLFWLDEAEPEYGKYDISNYRYYAGPGEKTSNLYPRDYAKGFYEGLAEQGEEQIVSLVRCAWAGSQKYGALVWSGDIHSTWEDFRSQITAGIHMGAAGIPWFTTDIGGFSGGDPDDPEFRELLVRWFQYGAFCPVMRMHGDRAPLTAVTAADGSERMHTGASNELWSYGEDAYEVLRKFVDIREALRPYLRTLMQSAHTDGQPIIRGLFYEFPEQDRAWLRNDQYMLGPDLLVAPVLHPGATERTVWLPEGVNWVDLRDGTVYEGGAEITSPAPLDTLPVFAREGCCEELVGML